MMAESDSSFKVLPLLVFVGNIIGQSMQNICLPLALSGGDDMSVVFIYTAFVYFMFFSILDVILEPLVEGQEDVKVSQKALINVGFQNTLNGIGAIFGGSASRTPLTMQMSGSLVLNLAAPFYKLWVFDMGIVRNVAHFGGWYLLACVFYIVSFILTLVDKLNNASSGELSPFCLLFWVGVIFGMTYNVHQEKMMHQVHFTELTLLQSLKISTRILRKQLTWLFIFSWLSIALAKIPSFDQVTFTKDGFYQSWSDFLPFTNVYMNLFNFGYILSFVTSVFMNKYDSSFNMLTSNISAVLSLWTGWVPTLRAETVGFFPNVGMTVSAMILSCVAIYPSYRYSLQMKSLIKKHEDETSPLLKRRDEPHQSMDVML